MKHRLISNKELLLALILTGVYLLTGFTPNPLAWPYQIQSRLILTQTVQPDDPQIELLNNEFEEFMQVTQIRERNPSQDLEFTEAQALETFLWIKIPYKSDFDNYLSWEYFPTISEILKKGDDCDGMSIVACSLLTRRGYENYIVFGKWHSWIEVHLGNGSTITLFDSELQAISPWYMKYNSENVYFREILVLDVILHNFLLILFLEKLTLTIFLFIRRYDAFQKVYATLIGILLSTLPTLFIIMSIT